MNPFSLSSTFLGLMASFAITSVPQSAFGADTDVENLYKEGMYLRETGQLFSAIDTLEAALAVQPTLQRIRLELAVAYYRTMNYERAKAEAQRVLDDPKTPDNVKLAVSVFIAQLKKDQEFLTEQRSAVRPYFTTGLLYDTNVNAGPNGDAVLPGGLTLVPGSTPQEDWAVTLQGGVSHTYQSPTSVRFGETAARFQWKSQAGLFHRSYFSKSEFNLTVATLATGPAWIAPGQWRANVNLQADYLTLGSNKLAWYWSLAPSMTWQTVAGEVTADMLFINRDFSRANDQGRDSNYTAAGLAYGHLYKKGKAAVQVGLHFFNEDASASQFSNDGREWFVGGNLSAWSNGTVNVRYSQSDAHYHGLVPVFALERDESEKRLEVGFVHKFTQGKMKDWQLNGSIQRTNNSSNVSIYTYQRSMTSLTLGSSF